MPAPIAAMFALKSGQSLLQNRAFIITISVIILVLVIFLYGRSKGKKAAEEVQIKPVNLPTGEQWNPQPLAQRLYESMSGINATGIVNYIPGVGAGLSVIGIGDRRTEVIAELAALPTDSMFIAVNNAFNAAHTDKKKGSLRNWIENEAMGPFNRAKNSALDRFKRLNIA